MSDELITIDNVSKELLKSIFDAAFMDTSLDKDGRLLVGEQGMCNVVVEKERGLIIMGCNFTFKPNVRDDRKLACANEINKGYMMVRALVVGQKMILIYDIPLDGGITKKHLVLLVRRFYAIPSAAIMDCAKDMVE